MTDMREELLQALGTLQKGTWDASWGANNMEELDEAHTLLYDFLRHVPQEAIEKTMNALKEEDEEEKDDDEAEV